MDPERARELMIEALLLAIEEKDREIADLQDELEDARTEAAWESSRADDALAVYDDGMLGCEDAAERMHDWFRDNCEDLPKDIDVPFFLSATSWQNEIRKVFR